MSTAKRFALYMLIGAVIGFGFTYLVFLIPAKDGVVGDKPVVFFAIFGGATSGLIVGALGALMNALRNLK